MSAKPSFSLGRALAAAAGSLPAAWSGAWLAIILTWAVSTFGLPFVLSADWQLGHNGGSFVYASGHFPLLAVYAVVMLILSLTTKGAVYRAILFGKDAVKEGLGLGGLQFGWPELRLLASDLLTGLFMLVVFVAVIIVFAIAFSTTGQGHAYANSFAAIHALFGRHEGSDWVFIVYLVGAWIFLLFLTVRFALRHAATVAERRVVALNALSLSTGNVGKLFLGLIVIVIPFCVICCGLIHLLGHVPGHAVPSLHPHMSDMSLELRAILHALLIGVAGPLLAGFLASAYRQIVDLRAK